MSSARRRRSKATAAPPAVSVRRGRCKVAASLACCSIRRASPKPSRGEQGQTPCPPAPTLAACTQPAYPPDVLPLDLSPSPLLPRPVVRQSHLIDALSPRHLPSRCAIGLQTNGLLSGRRAPVSAAPCRPSVGRPPSHVLCHSCTATSAPMLSTPLLPSLLHQHSPPLPFPILLFPTPLRFLQVSKRAVCCPYQPVAARASALPA